VNSKVWFITGTSRGFGRVWAEAALQRGDKVAATARTLADVADLTERFGDSVLPLALDVTDVDQVRQAVAQAHAHFGRLDVVLNNAGYSLVGTVEEAGEADVRAEFDTNYFGTLRVIQAALPLLRQQGSGHILGVSSTVGLVAFPIIGSYCASKWAFEALHESLAQEVKAFGIKVTLIEPGAYATEFGKSAKRVDGMEAYADLRKQVMANLMNIFRSWTRKTRRCASSSATKIYPRCVPSTRTASPLGKHGKPYPTPRKASRRNKPSLRSIKSIQRTKRENTMQDKPVALVTGANQGIGLQIAKDLTAHGFTVLVGSRNLENGETAAESVGADARALQLDVTDAASIAAAAERIRSEMGRLDVLVNNAAISNTRKGNLSLQEYAKISLASNASLDEIRAVWETNVFGVLAVYQAMLPLLRESSDARIVNVSSGVGSLTTNADPTYPYHAFFSPVYPASKTALNAMTLAMMVELESTRIKVNLVSPGFTKTNLNGYEGLESVEEGSREVVRVALLGPDGPSGTFTRWENVTIPW